MNLFEKHQTTLVKAIDALHARTFYAAFPENPSPANYGESADSQGKERFQASLGKKFEELHQGDSPEWIGQEESPYTQEPLEIKYPAISTMLLVARASTAFHLWRKVNVQDRAGILIESLERLKARFFEIAYATMHTTGQALTPATVLRNENDAIDLSSDDDLADDALELLIKSKQEAEIFNDLPLFDVDILNKFINEWFDSPNLSFDDPKHYAIISDA